MAEPNRDKVDELKKVEELRQEALDWVLHLKVGEPTERDLEDCKAWRARSLEHEESFREAALLWRQLSVAARELGEEARNKEAVGDGPTPVGDADSITAFSQSRKHFIGRRAFVGGAIAASVIGYMVVRPPFGLWPSLAELNAAYRTATGEQRRIAFGNGAVVKMNTQTSLRVNNLPNALEIDLISGEALVETSNTSHKSLIVKALDGRISSHGAKFNVRCLDGEVYVTCVKGTVEVEQRAESLVLNADEELSYSQRGRDAMVAVDAADVTSWQHKLLIFRDRRLYDVIKEVNRYLPGKIIVMNAQLGHKIVNGTFHVDRLNDVIGQVQHLFGAHVTSLPGLTFLS
jgi:transmembrane sensor